MLCRQARHVLLVLAAAGLLAGGCGSEEPASRAVPKADEERAFAKAPAPLKALHEDANKLLEADRKEFQTVLAGLKGHPIVVNKWASWCGPCRHEFPFFQEQAIKYGGKVAFIGLNSGDSTGEARQFLDRYPVAFPSYEDPREQIANSLGASLGYPTTIFIDAQGRRTFVRQGGYADAAALVDDIERYALGRKS